MVLSTGAEFDSALIVWTAGNGANPVIGRHTDLPVDARGHLAVRIGTEPDPVPDAWAAGDAAAVPDLAVPGTRAVPNAQHAYRQGKSLASVQYPRDAFVAGGEPFRGREFAVSGVSQGFQRCRETGPRKG